MDADCCQERGKEKESGREQHGRLETIRGSSKKEDLDQKSFVQIICETAVFLSDRVYAAKLRAGALIVKGWRQRRRDDPKRTDMLYLT